METDIFLQKSQRVTDTDGMEATYPTPVYQSAPLFTLTAGPDPRATGPIHVLLVEDDPDSAELVKLQLEEAPEDPFEVEWCENVVDAMNRVAEPGIDIILLDLGLPELKGYKSYRAIGIASADRIPVMILTSDERELTRELTLGFGAAGYLLKGKTSPAELRKALREAVLAPRVDPSADRDGDSASR